MRDAPPGNEIVTARRDVLGVGLDDCLVLYDPRTERAHVLDAGAARIWGMLQGGSTIAALTADLGVHAGASEVAVAADVADTVARLASEQLLGDGPEAPDRDRRAEAAPTPIERVLELGRPRSATLSALDRTVAFESDNREIVAAIDWLAAPLVTREPPGEVHLVDGAWDRTRLFPSRLNRIAAASTAVSVLHAGAVVVGDVVIALPGAPQAGKSTLTTQLVIDGCGYLTDEVLGVAPQSLGVVGFPKRISLEIGSWPLFPQLGSSDDTTTHHAFDPTRVRWVDPRALHPHALSWRGRPLELGIGVIARYEPRASLACERLTPVDVLTELLANSFNLGEMGAQGLETLRGVAASVPFFRLTHGGIDVAAPTIRELLIDEDVAMPQ